MNKMKLDELLQQYLKVQEEENALKEKKESLRDAIVAEMKATDKKSYKNDFAQASMCSKETFSYTDELAIIDYLTKNGYSNFVSATIKKSELNKELKISGGVLSESLKPLYNKTVTEQLTVKAN